MGLSSCCSMIRLNSPSPRQKLYYVSLSLWKKKRPSLSLPVPPNVSKRKDMAYIHFVTLRRVNRSSRTVVPNPHFDFRQTGQLLPGPYMNSSSSRPQAQLWSPEHREAALWLLNRVQAIRGTCATSARAPPSCLGPHSQHGSRRSTKPRH